MSSRDTSFLLNGRGHPELGVFVGCCFAIMPMITLVSVRILGVSAQGGTALRLAITYMLFGLTAGATFGESSHRKPWTAPVKWASSFIVVAGCSFAWTQAASPATSAAYLMATVCEFGVVLLLLNAGPVEVTVRAIMKGFVAGALLVALVAWVMPAQYDLRLGDEEYLNSNNIAYVCSFAAFFVQYLMRRRQVYWGLAFVVLMATILRSISKATIGAFLVSEIWLLAKSGWIPRKTKLFVIGSTVLVLAMLSGLFLAYFDIYTTLGNQSETLTGRTAIWAWALSEGLERPWLGHGFDSMWKVAPLFGTFEARHAENEILQQFYSFGVAGVAVLIGCYWSLWRLIRTASEPRKRVVFSAVVIFIAIRGLAEAEPFDLLLPLWMVAMIAGLLNSDNLAALPVRLMPPTSSPSDCHSIVNSEVSR